MNTAQQQPAAEGEDVIYVGFDKVCFEQRLFHMRDTAERNCIGEITEYVNLAAAPANVAVSDAPGVVAWCQQKEVWLTHRAPADGLHALVRADALDAMRERAERAEAQVAIALKYLQRINNDDGEEFLNLSCDAMDEIVALDPTELAASGAQGEGS